MLKLKTTVSCFTKYKNTFKKKSRSNSRFFFGDITKNKNRIFYFSLVSLLAFAIYFSKAIVIEGASGEGAIISTLNP